VTAHVETLSADRLVDVSDWDLFSATAVDSKGNKLPRLDPPVNGATTGTVRHGNPVVMSFVFESPVPTAEWVDVAFGPAALRAPVKP
jgi:hypothetical protein